MAKKGSFFEDIFCPNESSYYSSDLKTCLEHSCTLKRVLKISYRIIMMAFKSLCSIKTDDQSFFLFVTTHEEEAVTRSFDIVLTDAINAWSGSVSNNLLKTLSKKIGEKFDQFVDETRKALTKVDVKKQIFEYQISTVEDGCRELAWKRVMSDENIKFQLGSVVLKPADDPSIFLKDIIKYSMDEIASSKKKINHLEREQERLSNERGQALKRLEKCVEMKEHMDKDLYSKFCIILNEKKAKIRQLHQNGIPRDTPADPTPLTSVKSENDDESAEMKVDGGEEEREDDTDEEKEVSKQAKKSKREKREVEEDDSLILEDEEEQPSTSHAKRRRRKPDEKPVAMSSKPSIPRVASTPKNTSPSTSGGRSARMPSQRKTPSSTRRGKSAEVDASDLFDEM